MRFAPAVIALSVVVTMPALGGQSGAVVDLWSAPSVLPPADSGKPANLHAAARHPFASGRGLPARHAVRHAAARHGTQEWRGRAAGSGAALVSEA